MNKYRNLLLIVAGIIVGALILLLVVKTFNRAEKIVYVDLQKVYKDFKMKGEMEKEAEMLIKNRQLMLDSIATELQSIETDVIKNKNKELRNSFEKEKENYFQKKQYFENSNQQIIEQYNAKLWEEIQRLSVDYAKAEGYDIILGKGAAQSFVYGSEKLDCTNEFIEYINQHYEKKK